MTRTRILLALAVRPRARHDALRFCPGMVEHTSLAVEWLADGAKMIIRADHAPDVPRLQSTTLKRARALAARSHVAVR